MCHAAVTLTVSGQAPRVPHPLPSYSLAYRPMNPPHHPVGCLEGQCWCLFGAALPRETNPFPPLLGIHEGQTSAHITLS